jgi:carbonic anhydrase
MAAYAADSTPAIARQTKTPDAIWTELLEGNKRFVAGKQTTRDIVQIRKELAKGQQPRVVVLTCADSRLSPELIFDATLGELFVVRVAGNITDPIVLGSIEYAVDHLHANTLVVLGHEKCGAVAAAASGERMPTQNLEAIVTTIKPALEEAGSLVDAGDRSRNDVESNVRRVVQDLLRNSDVLREKSENGNLGIFQAVYQLESGDVSPLK